MRETIRIPAKVAERNVTVITHTNPHADEILALFLMEEYGTGEFLRQHCRNGEVWVGVGNGHLDDHKTSEKGSSAMLMAQALKIERVPQIAGLLAYVHRVDSEGGDTPFNLCSIIKTMGQLEYPENEVIDWACRGFWAKANELQPTKDFSLQYVAMLLIARNGEKGTRWLDYGMKARVDDHKAFFVEAKADFKAKAHTKTIITAKGNLKLCWVESDNAAIARFARSEFGAKADIVIVRKSGGNVAIMTDKRTGLDLADLAAALRAEERQLRNLPPMDPAALRAANTIDESWDVWHFAHGCMLLNGSHTAKGISPTAIPLDSLLSLISNVLDPTFYEPDCSAMCQMNVCPAESGTPCRLHAFGLARCRAIRAGQ